MVEYSKAVDEQERRKLEFLHQPGNECALKEYNEDKEKEARKEKFKFTIEPSGRKADVVKDKQIDEEDVKR